MIWTHPFAEGHTGHQELQDEFTWTTTYPIISLFFLWGSVFLQSGIWVFCSQPLLSQESPSWTNVKIQLCKPRAESRVSGSHSNHIHFNELTNSLWVRNCWVFYFPENLSRMSSLGWLLRECFSTFLLQCKVMAPCFVLTGVVHLHIPAIHIFILWCNKYKHKLQKICALNLTDVARKHFCPRDHNSSAHKQSSGSGFVQSILFF